MCAVSPLCQPRPHRAWQTRPVSSSVTAVACWKPRIIRQLRDELRARGKVGMMRMPQATEQVVFMKFLIARSPGSAILKRA